MTVGSGILWSTVLVLMAVMAYQLSIHRKWRVVGKIVGGFVVLVLVTAGGLWAWDHYENRPRVVEMLDGVRLGMSPLDVKLAKGAPEDEGKPKNVAGSFTAAMVFRSRADGPTLFVLFGGTGTSDLKVEMVCETDGYSRLLGFGRDDSEEEVIAKLGQPTNTSVAKDGLSKIVSFKPFKAAFGVSKGLVSEVCAAESGKVSFSEEYQADQGEKSK